MQNLKNNSYLINYKFKTNKLMKVEINYKEGITYPYLVIFDDEDLVDIGLQIDKNTIIAIYSKTNNIEVGTYYEPSEYWKIFDGSITLQN